MHCGDPDGHAIHAEPRQELQELGRQLERDDAIGEPHKHGRHNSVEQEQLDRHRALSGHVIR